MGPLQWGCLGLLGPSKSKAQGFRFLRTPRQIPYDQDGTPFGEWRHRSEAMIAYHLAAVEFQLSQIHAGWSIALALNRTFILPKVTQRSGSIHAFVSGLPSPIHPGP